MRDILNPKMMDGSPSVDRILGRGLFLSVIECIEKRVPENLSGNDFWLR